MLLRVQRLMMAPAKIPGAFNRNHKGAAPETCNLYIVSKRFFESPPVGVDLHTPKKMAHHNEAKSIAYLYRPWVLMSWRKRVESLPNLGAENNDSRVALKVALDGGKMSQNGS